MDTAVRKSLVKVLASVLVAGGGVGYLLYSTAGEAFEYYKHVDEVVAESGKWQKRPMQVHGYVMPGSINKRFDQQAGRLEYRFDEVNCGKQIPVYYVGVPPDTFKDGAEVVVKGELDGASFRSTEISAKCPSKYEATKSNTTMCATGRGN